VRIVAARAAAHPAFELAVLAGELQDASARLDALDAGDPRSNLRAVLSWSVQALSAQAAGVFGLLGIAAGTDIGLPAAASLADLPEGQVRVVLRELESTSLVLQDVPGRYRMHDLIRLYAGDTAHRDLDEDRRHAATDRLLDYYLAMTRAADTHLRARSGQVIPETEVFAGQEEALAWLDTEQANLTAAVGLAADTQRHRVAVDLASCLAEFLGWRRQFTDSVAVAQVAARAATHLNDPARQADALVYLGLAMREVRRFEEAITAHTQARDIYRDLGDRHGEGTAWNNLGNALQEVRRFEEA
jgi:tetratricopeptide (TPR) repeat protein